LAADVDPVFSARRDRTHGILGKVAAKEMSINKHINMFAALKAG
jgi:hypothetical protein